MAERLPHRIYNVASGRASSNKDVVAAIRKAAPGAPGNVLKPGRTPGNAVNPATDLSRIKTDVGYEPAHTLDGGIAAYIEWLRQHPQ
jgi:UDP-glucose 4-epimerase